MTSIICICHYYNFVVSHFFYIKFSSDLSCSSLPVGLPTPAPIAVMSTPISLLVRICFGLAFQHLKFYLSKEEFLIFSILPCFADPPAESPSTINNSENSDFLGNLLAYLAMKNFLNRFFFSQFSCLPCCF